MNIPSPTVEDSCSASFDYNTKGTHLLNEGIVLYSVMFCIYYNMDMIVNNPKYLL